MKKIITLLILLFTITISAQDFIYYEGSAKVTFKDDIYSIITFGRNGYSPTSFIVRDSTLIEGNYYHFYLQKVKFKGTKETAKILLKHIDQKQILIEKKKLFESVKGNFIWL